jgi:chitin disaccharide deacetylase
VRDGIISRLVVNADDLGLTEGVNRGILEAHERGIVTGASLMVDRPAAAAAVERGRASGLSIGLHAELDDVPPEEADAELRRQLARFEELVGARPTHVDTHHHLHRQPAYAPAFGAFAEREGLRARDRTLPHEGRFYGEVGVDALLHVLATLPSRDVELGCHPGYAEGLSSSYRAPREQELRTLTDARVRARIDELGLVLAGWGDLHG